MSYHFGIDYSTKNLAIHCLETGGQFFIETKETNQRTSDYLNMIFSPLISFLKSHNYVDKKMYISWEIIINRNPDVAIVMAQNKGLIMALMSFFFYKFELKFIDVGSNDLCKAHGIDIASKYTMELVKAHRQKRYFIKKEYTLKVESMNILNDEDIQNQDIVDSVIMAYACPILKNKETKKNKT